MYRHGSKPSGGQRTLALELELVKSSYLDIDKIVESFMSNLKESGLIGELKSTQLRKIHEQVIKVRRLSLEDRLEECKKELVRFRYLLAYQEARLRGREGEVFRAVSEWFRRSVETIIKNIQDKRLVGDLIEKMYLTSEMIIAYHKYHGGE